MKTNITSDSIYVPLTATPKSKKAGMKIRDIIKLVETDGWHQVGTRSHRQYKHPAKPGRVTIAGHHGDVLAREL